MTLENSLPRVVADGPLDQVIQSLLAEQVTLLPWELTETGSKLPVNGIYTYGHLPVNGKLLDRLPGVRVISNYGVGVDHIDLAAAAQRGIPVGNTPEVLSGATADMAFALLLATGRRLVEGDRYARSPDFITHDPGHMLGLEVHGTTLGILGMGRIGREIARRGLAFNMHVRYHNRHRDTATETSLGVEYCTFPELLSESDYLVLCVPLTDATRGLMGRAQLKMMKSTSILINISRGAIVDTAALTEALQQRQIYGAGLDVTEPEPLPREHPLLKLDNLTITPHLGSATVQTRRSMAEMSVENLMLGLAGKPLLCEVHL